MIIVNDAVPAFVRSLKKSAALISLTAGESCSPQGSDRWIMTYMRWKLNTCDADRYVPADVSLKRLSFCP